MRLFIIARKRNKIITMHWFRRTATKVWKCLYPGGSDVFVFSHGWFWQFLRRAGIIRRRITKTASKPPSEMVKTVNSFIQFVRKHSRRQGKKLYHATILRSSLPPIISSPPANGPTSSPDYGPANSPPKEPASSPVHNPANSPAVNGSSNGTASPPTYLFPPKKTSLRRFPSKLIINLNETPLPFEFLSGYTYNWKKVTTIAGRSDRNSWNKRQATIILYIMANGNTPFKPVIIFYGQRTVLAKKQSYYNPKIEVHFNPTAYHNEEMFL
jgi:hypothetical protein